MEHCTCENQAETLVSHVAWEVRNCFSFPLSEMREETVCSQLFPWGLAKGCHIQLLSSCFWLKREGMCGRGVGSLCRASTSFLRRKVPSLASLKLSDVLPFRTIMGWLFDCGIWLMVFDFYWKFIWTRCHMSNWVCNRAFQWSCSSAHSLLHRAPAPLHHRSVASIRGDPNVWAKASGAEHWTAKASFYYLRGVRNFFFHCGYHAISRVKVACVFIFYW